MKLSLKNRLFIALVPYCVTLRARLLWITMCLYALGIVLANVDLRITFLLATPFFVFIVAMRMNYSESWVLRIRRL